MTKIINLNRDIASRQSISSIKVKHTPKLEVKKPIKDGKEEKNKTDTKIEPNKTPKAISAGEAVRDKEKEIVRGDKGGVLVKV